MDLVDKKMADPFKLVDATLYLGAYVLEAVCFTEFIYHEALENGMRVLKQMEKRRNWSNLSYMKKKYLDNVYTPAWSFHKTFGPLNPWTYYAYECAYQLIWKEFQAIKS